MKRSDEPSEQIFGPWALDKKKKFSVIFSSLFLSSSSLVCDLLSYVQFFLCEVNKTISNPYPVIVAS